MRSRSLFLGIIMMVMNMSQAASLFAQVDETPLAQLYVEGALKAITAGRWQDAEALLKQGADFSNVSSDLSYLLALVRFQLEQPVGAVLEALRQAKMTDRWQRYTAEAASVLEAQALIQMRQFDQALQILQSLFPSADVRFLQLKIFTLQNNQGQFSRLFSQVVNTYPLDPRFAALYFGYMKDKVPGSQDPQLVSLLLQRLPALQKTDPKLPLLAVPFIQNLSDRRRIIEAYLAQGNDLLPILSEALNLGVIDETTALNTLADQQRISVELLRKVWTQLRTDASRRLFSEKFATYSGRITEDSDKDGISEVIVEYQHGRIQMYRFDANQDRIDEIRVFFEQGLPQHAFIAPYEDSLDVQVYWEQYPLVDHCTAGAVTYIPAPASFSYAPFKLKPIVGTYPEITLLFPEREQLLPRLTERSLVSFAAKIIRPGTLAKDSLETIELKNGLPLRSTETVKGRLISVLEFTLGQPDLQRIDMDLDGRFETIRRYRLGTVRLDPVEALAYQQRYDSIESDWDGDGVFEYKETLR